ncbi:alpha/beta hydrolase [Pimelobacter simplex]|uniref:alpha/beta hydrolase n=1 Tax=Nocardioides simplex TaxID=2045 RepID=UPI003813567A
MTTFPDPVVVRRGAPDADPAAPAHPAHPAAPTTPVVVLLHGRGADESSIIALADHLPPGPSYVAVRAPIAEGGGYAWFANRGIGRPVAASLAETMAWFRSWLDAEVPATSGRPVVLVGFSGGAAFAGGLLLAEPGRFAGAAILHGTLPFDAGVPVTPGRLAGVPVFVAQGEADTVIPRELLDATWTYLAADAGAVTTPWRDAGGHGVSAGAVAALGAWLETVTA